MIQVEFLCVSMQSDDKDFLREAALLIDEAHCARYLSAVKINAAQSSIELAMSDECRAMSLEIRNDVRSQLLNVFEHRFAAWDVTAI